MAEQKTWAVTYTAKRKVISHQEAQMSITVTEDEIRTLLKMDEGDTIGALDDDVLENAIKELAEVHGQLSEDWNETSEDESLSDAENFEITETP